MLINGLHKLKNVNTTDMYIEGANGQIEINPNYKAPAAPKPAMQVLPGFLKLNRK